MPETLLDTFLLSRIQFAANISFHILFPSITIALAATCALIRPCAPMVSTCWRSSIVTSTWPSTVRSSLPLNSPLMTTLVPIFTVRCSCRDADSVRRALDAGPDLLLVAG